MAHDYLTMDHESYVSIEGGFLTMVYPLASDLFPKSMFPIPHWSFAGASIRKIYRMFSQGHWLDMFLSVQM